MNPISPVSVIIETELVREQYSMYSLPGLPLSVDTYVDLIAEWTGYTIGVSHIPGKGAWRSSAIRGMMHRFNDAKKAHIYAARVKQGPNDHFGVTFCENRFIVMKEACHLLIDSADTYATDAKSLIESLLFKSGPSERNSQNAAFMSEIYAMVAALELLFPWEERAGRLALIESGEKTHYDIANEYKIPERHVFWVLGKQIHENLSGIHSALRRRSTKGAPVDPAPAT